jgi:hypothetical protein
VWRRDEGFDEHRVVVELLEPRAARGDAQCGNPCRSPVP